MTIERQDRDGVATLSMAHGKANAVDLELFTALGDALEEIETDESVRAVVLTGTGRMFSAGVDLFRVQREGVAYLDRFLPALSHAVRRLFAFPKPVVAAVNGHAIAGGCVLVAACDHAVAAGGGGKLGLTELLVGVPFPPLVLEVIRNRVGDVWTRRLAYSGRLLSVAEAAAADLVDEVVEGEALEARAQDVASTLGGLDAGAFGLTKRQLRQPALDTVDGALAPLEADVAAVWKSPAALARIAAFLESTVGRGR